MSSALSAKLAYFSHGMLLASWAMRGSGSPSSLDSIIGRTDSMTDDMFSIVAP